MITINSVSDTKFSLNGTTYGKIYQPLAQGTEHISIVNVYDTSQKLVNSTHYSEFTLNGSTYNNQDTLISALILVLFSITDSGGSGGGSWGEITGTLSDQGDLQSALNGKANTSHTHSISNITGLQTALNGKASTSHTHAITDVTGLQTALNGKANTSHTHTISNITGLQTALDGMASSSHSHAITDVTGLQTALDGKLGTGAKAADSNLLDGIDSGSFLRSDQDDTTTGKLTIETARSGNFAAQISNTDGGASSNGLRLDVVNDSAQNTVQRWYVSGTEIARMQADSKFIMNGAGTVTASKFFESSDQRLKSNIEKLKPRPIEADYVSYTKNGEFENGLIAQEVEKTHPHLISTNKKGFKSLDYRGVFVNEIAALKETVADLQKEVETLKIQLNG